MTYVTTNFWRAADCLSKSQVFPHELIVSRVNKFTRKIISRERYNLSFHLFLLPQPHQISNKPRLVPFYERRFFTRSLERSVKSLLVIWTSALIRTRNLWIYDKSQNLLRLGGRKVKF